MDENWTYVLAGYVVTAGALGAYGGWIWHRTRRARRDLPSPGDAS